MPIFFLARRTVINTLDPQLSALVGGQCRAGAVVAATATAVTGWTGGGATTAAVTITKIAGDRTPGIGGKAGAASATISTAAAISRSKGNRGSPRDGAGSPPDQAPITDPRA